MTYYILGAMLFVLMLCVVRWFAAAKSLSWTEEEQAIQDQEQIEYLAQWAERRREYEEESA